MGIKFDSIRNPDSIPLGTTGAYSSVTKKEEEGRNFVHKEEEGEENKRKQAEDDPQVPGEQAKEEMRRDLIEEDDPKLLDVRFQVQIVKKKIDKKLKSLRLQKYLQTSIREAREDKQENNGKEKEGAISTGDAVDERYITDYPSSNEVYNIDSGESSSEFGDDEETLREKATHKLLQKVRTDNNLGNITDANKDVAQKLVPKQLVLSLGGQQRRTWVQREFCHLLMQEKKK
ncbi:hypothetical protein CDL15_Pgr018418 [Punica granatum]|uniref:Uncharacterized protein n=1 Tax=Punica granatum TaxID=22663 RepID=A0A218X068_PUNGR|nr:hypothetical protein CDL15_Pgr018418 [Punica granatum]